MPSLRISHISLKSRSFSSEARIVRIATGVANTTPDGVSQMVPDMMANAPQAESFDARGCGNAVMRRGDDQAAVISIKANSRRL